MSVHSPDRAPPPACRPTDDPLERPANRARLDVVRDVLSPGVWSAARSRLGAPPHPEDWARALSLGLALLGAALVGAAVIYALAFNWQAMGHALRLVLPILVGAGCALAGWSWGLERTGSLVLMSLAAVLVGAELLVYGQIYQTGAEPWTLFAAWAALIAPWVLIARFAPLTMAWICLVNVAFATLWETRDFTVRWREMSGVLLATGLNAALLFAWERWGERHLSAVAGRWGPRLLGVMTLGPITVGASWSVLETSWFWRLAPPLMGAQLLVLCGFHAAYRRRRRDLFQLTLLALSAATTVGVAGTRLLTLGTSFHAGLLLALAALVLGLVTVTALWLRAVHREGGA